MLNLSRDLLIELRANELVASKTSLPIDVHSLANTLGIQLFPSNLAEGLSGGLIIKNGKAIITYNKNESKIKNRFTIAHQIGHYVLHVDNTLHDDTNFFIDVNFKAKTLFQQNNPEIGSKKLEIEANEFAVCLLVPERHVKQEIHKLNLDYLEYNDDKSIIFLAKIFDVSFITMSLRLMNLCDPF